MENLQSVNWDQLLDLYKKCITSELGKLGLSGQYSEHSKFSEIASAGADANPIANLIENSSESLSIGIAPSSHDSANEEKFKVTHPISGSTHEISKPKFTLESIENLVSKYTKYSDSMKNFLTLWRKWPQELGMIGLSTSLAVPDNPAVNYVDMTSCIWLSRHVDDNGGAYLSFVLGPVQPFIKSARSVRDLWTGSAILSWLSFQAMMPILEIFGPTALIFPNLRQNPLMDIWLNRNFNSDDFHKPSREFCRSPSIPHRFVAMVPFGKEGEIANELAERCKKSVKDAWIGMASDVRDELNPKFSKFCDNWDRLWDKQIEHVFEFQTCVIPEKKLDDEELSKLIANDSFRDSFPKIVEIRNLFMSALTDETGSEPANAMGNLIRKIGRWQLHMDYSAKIMESKRSVRQVPKINENDIYDSNGKVPPKCSIYGTWEQMGPSELKKSKQFWEDVISSFSNDDVKGVRIGKRERFCSVALTKRFAAPVKLSEVYCQKPEDLRFPDTATIAAKNWLEKFDIKPDEERKKFNGRWNGLWLHNYGRQSNAANETEKNVKINDGELAPDEFKKRITPIIENSPPPSYYAILKMDGDNLGDWLSGTKAPKLKDILHPKVVESITAGVESHRNSDSAKPINFDQSRPVCPAIHSAISSALGNFATFQVPQIVRNYNGTVIYSGGDDLLALLPATNAVNCANELQEVYKFGDKASNGLDGMGKLAGISASIVFVHYMEDLRNALSLADRGENKAKDSGRDIANLYFVRRSGIHSRALLPWSRARWFGKLVSKFEEGASKGWTYKLHSEVLSVLGDETISSEALTSEIKRIGNRINDDFWEKIAEPLTPGEKISNWWKKYKDSLEDGNNVEPDKISFFESFAVLCQGAALVARGQDDQI